MRVDTPLALASLAEAGAEAQRLEALGYDGAFTFDGPHDPFLPLVQAAAATERLELFTGVAIAFARTPMGLAQIGHDLQVLSRGRFRLGLGSQVRAHIERRFSQPWSQPAARMREFVSALRAIWSCWNDGAPLAFYASTPAYGGVLDSVGRGALHPELHALSRSGDWQAMAALVDDELLEAIAVCAPFEALGQRIAERYAGIADRISLVAPWQPDAGAWAQVVRALQATGV